MNTHHIEKIFYNNEDFLSYQKLTGSALTIIFLGGFHSDMFGSKANYLYNYCQQKNYSFIRFDYFGHGLSSGNFIDGNIGLWLENCLSIIDKLTTGKVIIIGSSMGGWLMLLAALARPNKVIGLIGIASAPDFTETLIWDALTPHQQAAIIKDNTIFPNLGDCDYKISYNLITEARNHLLLNDKINLLIPITLLHGMLDTDVPYETSINLAKKITSEDIKLILIKNADHRMSTRENLQLLSSELELILSKVKV